MNAITKLPGRPLSQREITALDDGSRLDIVPYGGVPVDGEVEVYALKLAVSGVAHALGYDEDREQWRHLGSVDASDLAAADRQLDPVLDDWVQESYGRRFQVLKPQ